MPLSEREGRAVLKRRFEAAGLTIVEDHPLKDGELDLVADGFDVTRRIGYEYLTTEAGDRLEVTGAQVAALDARMAAGDLLLLLIDEHDVADEAELGDLADRFLAELRTRGRLS